MQRLEEHRARLEAVELLRILRRAGLSYRELELVTGVPKSSLAQYVSGQRLPSGGQALLILEKLLADPRPVRLVASRLNGLSSLADLADAVLDPLVLRYASLWAAHRYRGRVDIVLSAETYGIPLATAIALALGSRLVVSRREAGSPSRDYLQATGGDPPFGVKVLYVPRDMITPGSRVLLVDDLARSGATLEALARASLSLGARVVAAIVLIAVGQEWRRRLERLGVGEAHAFLEVGG